MDHNLGEKIRELRKGKNISQEVLAQFLGVSFQAVSKWENNTALPDVTLIPAIASFFEVSTDDLFDYNRMEIEKKVMDLCYEAAEYRQSDPAKSEKMLRDALKQYPGNDIILNNLLYTMRAPERSDEVITICKALIASTRLDDVKYDAIRIMAETYQTLGEIKLAEEALETIPEIYFTKLELVAQLLDGDKALEAAEVQKRISADQVIDMLLIKSELLKKQDKYEDALKHERIAKKIIEVYREEEKDIFETASEYKWMREKYNSIKKEDF